MRILITPADPLCSHALCLLAEAVEEANLRYPEFVVPGAAPPTNAPPVPRSSFVLASLDDVVVGCGALRPLDASSGRQIAEIKRMFVLRAVRRQGVARAIVVHLLADALGFGFDTVRLETGNRQPEAQALYAALGFRRIAPFGRYVDDPTSVCFERELT